MTTTPAGGQPGSSLDRMLAALDAAGVRYQHRGNHIQAECPTHADQQPSLSIDYKPASGNTVLNCQASCPGEDVLAALDLTWPQLHDDFLPAEEFKAKRDAERAAGVKPSSGRAPRRQVPSERKMPALPKGRLPKRLTEAEPTPVSDWGVTKTWDYVNHAGEVVQQEVKHERTVALVDPVTGKKATKTEKRFTQRWPKRDGSWVDKMPAGYEAPLYNQPSVVDAIEAGERIYLAEGAKDADCLAEHGVVATTNPSGAGNFKPSQATTLAGAAEVIVTLDHDVAGYKRGQRLQELLSGRVGVLRFALPATTGRHQDVVDHFAGGYGLDDFAFVTLEQLQLLEQVATAEDAATAARTAAAEAAVRSENVSAGPHKKAEDEQRYAERWAAEAGKQLAAVVRAYDAALSVSGGPVDGVTQIERIVAAITACQEATAAAYEAAGVEIPEATADLLDTDVTEAPEPAPDNVRELPTKSGNLPRPNRELTMSRGDWAYETTAGEGRMRRGVYMYESRGEEGRWKFMAPLPFVHARIINRDGGGNPTGTFYLVSATADSERVMIGQAELQASSWPNILNLAVPYDDKILRAATSALLDHATRDAEIVEATPRFSDGKMSLPLADTMPDGYLETSGLTRSDAIATWAEILISAAESPKMALAFGASAVSPFIGQLPSSQSHVFALYGDPLKGKSTTLHALSGMWGRPGGPGKPSGVMLQWNATSLSVPAFLGALSVLPAFMDEIGQAGAKHDSEWGQLISNIAQGASRMRMQRNKPGVERTLPWAGIFFSTGNAQMGHGLGGRNSGVPRRIVELETPFTVNEDQAERIDELVLEAYGHIGIEILNKFELGDVQPLVEEALELLGGRELPSDHERAIAKHLASHLAGAKLLDKLCGTNGRLHSAAVIAAAEYLDACAPPPHDADQLLEELGDWIAREPGAWPSREQYNVLKRARAIDEIDTLPQHGFARELAGYIDDDGTVMVTGATWKRMVRDLEITAAVALRRLYERHLLRVNEQRRRRGEWTIPQLIRDAGGHRRQVAFYAITLPEEDLAQGTENAATPAHFPAEPVTDVTNESSEAHLLGVLGMAETDPQQENRPLTCGVGGVGGVGGENGPRVGAREEIHFSTPQPAFAGAAEHVAKLTQPEACVACGEPTGYALNGTPVHIGGECADALSQPTPEATEQLELDSEAPEAAEEPAEPAQAAQEPSSAPTAPRAAQRTAEAGYRAGAAVVDVDGIWLSNGEQLPLPKMPEHVGHLMRLAQWLNLGSKVTAKRREAAQIWITDALARQMGIELEAIDEAQDSDKDAVAHEATVTSPAVLKALEEGYRIGGRDGDSLGRWTRVWHGDESSVFIVLLAAVSRDPENMPIMAGDPDPAALAKRLGLFSDALGHPFKLSGQTTGLDLMMALPKAGKSLFEPRELVLPETFNIELDLSWTRQPTTEELEQQWVHAYDRSGSYLAGCSGLDLGIGDPIHHPEGTAFAPRTPGYWRITIPEAGDWRMPNPLDPRARDAGRDLWVTSPGLEFAIEQGYSPEILEAYTWQERSRFLDGWNKRIGDARTALDTEDPDAQAARDQIKTVYASTIGMMGSHNFMKGKPGYAPGWRHHIVSKARTNILRRVAKIGEETGRWPVAIHADTVLYTSNEADPIAAWPGGERWYGRELGRYKHEGTVKLADHLEFLNGKSPYAGKEHIAKRRPGAE